MNGSSKSIAKNSWTGSPPIKKKRNAAVFILAFALNWAWEIAHSGLYAHYQNGSISSLVLFRAALVDAGIILGLFLVAQKFKINKPLVIVIGGLIIAVVIEVWALQTGRWAYNSLMPIVPLIQIGLTPFIQLAATGYITHLVAIVSSD